MYLFLEIFIQEVTLPWGHICGIANASYSKLPHQTLGFYITELSEEEKAQRAGKQKNVVGPYLRPR